MVKKISIVHFAALDLSRFKNYRAISVLNHDFRDAVVSEVPLKRHVICLVAHACKSGHWKLDFQRTTADSDWVTRVVRHY